MKEQGILELAGDRGLSLQAIEEGSAFMNSLQTVVA